MSVFIIISIAAALLFIGVQLAKENAAGTVMKSIASLCFVSLGAYSLSIAGQPAFLPVIALTAGLIGDVLLGVYVTGGKFGDKAYLYGGFITFGLEHIIFTSLVFRSGAAGSKQLITAFVIAIVFAASGTVAEKKFMGYDFRGHTVSAACYTIVLTCALVFDILAGIASPRFMPMLIGMVLFFISDVVLSMIYFNGKNTKPLVALNLITYYAAQIIIAANLGAMFD